jgi:hypothetical protein
MSSEAYIGPAPKNSELGISISEQIPSYIQEFLKTATNRQLSAIGEFIAVLEKDGDSGSIHSTLEVCVDMSGVEYVERCLETIKHMREGEGTFWKAVSFKDETEES